MGITLFDMMRRVKAMDIEKIVFDAMDANLTNMADENKKQLYAGLDKTGEKITPGYQRNKYARVKNEMNPLPGLGTRDLFATGKFYVGITFERQGDVIQEKSSVSYAEFLEKYKRFGLGGRFKKIS